MKKLGILLCLCMVMLLPDISLADETVKILSKEAYEGLNQQFTMLDLTSVANKGFTDDVAGDGKGGWTDQGSANDMSCLDISGVNNLLGIDFNIIDPRKNGGNSAVILRGQNNENYPVSAEITVGKKAAGVYFLHCAAWVSAGKKAGEYVFCYEDGTEYVKPLIGGEDIFDWWGVAGANYCRTVWQGSNSSSTVSLRALACANPYPDKKIEKIIARTTGTDSYVMLVAATATDAGPYLPEVDDPNPDTSDWYKYNFPNYAESIGTPIDVSYLLDKPAGKHGYIRTNGDGFEFEDGTKVQFWGVNLAIFSMFQDGANSEVLADTLASKGINLVRFHGLDANLPMVDSHTSKMRFNEGKVDMLCNLLAELKERGIYYMIDIKVNKVAIYEDDNLPDGATLYEESFFNDQLIDVKADLAEALLSIYNPYTSYTIGTDPALVLVDIDNETSLVGSEGITNERYAKELDSLFSAAMKEKYGSNENILKAWKTEEYSGLEAGEDVNKGNIHAYGYKQRPLKSEARQIDTVSFMADMERRSTSIITERMRSIGVKAPVTGTTMWGRSILASGYSNSNCDYVDFHTYWKHPHNGEGWSTGMIFDGPESMLTNKNLGMVGDCMRMRMYNKPFTISEWLSLQPNKYVSEQFPMMAAYMKLQGANPIIYAWDHTKDKSRFAGYIGDVERLPRYQESPFAMVDFPDDIAALPAAALLFHRDVTEAEKGYFSNVYSVDETLLQKNQTMPTPYAFSTVGKSGFAIDDKNGSFDPEYNDNEVLYYAKQGDKTGRYVSVTGEICLDRNKDIMFVNTKSGQVASGFIGNENIELDDVVFDIENEYATVYYNSVTDKPLWESGKNLITVIGRAVNTGQKLTQDGTAFENSGRGPVLIEPIYGDITLKTKDTLKVYALTSEGKRISAVYTQKDKNGYTKFSLTGGNQAMFYEVVKECDKSAKNAHVDFGVKPYEAMFDDLAGYAENRKQIERAALLELIEYSGKTFNPNGEISRLDALYAIMTATGKKGDSTDSFADVTPDTGKKYETACLAKTLGVCLGDGEGNFYPARNITKGEFYTLVERLTGETFGDKTDNSLLTRAEAALCCYDLLNM